MAASLDCYSSGCSGVRHSKAADRLVCVAPHDTSPKPRARPGACEGLKRTTSGSEADKLPVVRGGILNKTAPFYDPRGAEASAAQTSGRSEKTAILSRRQVKLRTVDAQRQVQLRHSKQLGTSSTLRSISNNAKERPTVGLSDRVYESTKLAALFDVLVAQGCPAGEILRDVNLTVDEVHSPKSRISLADLIMACKNAIRRSSDPHLPYRIGASIHISASGMYGFAILCCPDFRKAMAFAELYHALAAPLATIEFTEEKEFASWVIEPNARAATDPQIYRFITEMQIGIHISLMRDVMGPAFTPDRISLAYPKADDFNLAADEIG